MFRFLISFSCLIVLSALGLNNPPNASGKAPHIVFVGNDADTLEKGARGNRKTARLDQPDQYLKKSFYFGKIKCYEKQTVSFRLKNTGEGTGAILSLKPTCSCVSSTADKMRFGNQEEIEVRVMVDPIFVNGVFNRGLWVETNDPERPHLYISLRGEVLPLFYGLPKPNAEPQQFVLTEGASWTNRFTFTEAETNLHLGTPSITADTNKLHVAATLKTNTNTQKNTSFDITLVVTALASGRHLIVLSIPVTGRPNLKPVKLAFYANVGAEELKAAPSRVSLTPTEQPLTRKLYIMTANMSSPTNALLTWTPQRKGVTVHVQANTNNLYMQVTLTLSPEAVSNLLKENDPKLTFNCPNYRSVSVNFVSRPEPSTSLANEATGN